MFQDLPCDILERLVDAVAASNSTTTTWHPLLSLSCVNRELRVMIRPSTWQVAWDSVRRSEPRAEREAKRAPIGTDCRELVRLCASRRCMMCGAAAARVYWCFGVRSCRGCLNARTISGDELMRRHFALNKPPWKRMRHMSAKSLRERRYWYADVLGALRTHFAAGTLEDYEAQMAQLHAGRVQNIVQCINAASNGCWSAADLQTSSTFRKITGCVGTMQKTERLAARILHEVAEERARLVAESRRREHRADRQRLRDAAVAAAAWAWQGRAEGRDDVTCPRCRSHRRFTQRGLIDHFCDVHVRLHESKAVRRIDRRPSEHLHPLFHTMNLLR